MKIYVFRHGETDWNAQHRIQGRENVPLNDAGRQQAHDMGRAITGRIHPAYFLSSNLDRAKETAAILASYVGTDDFYTEPDLTECSYGRLSGTVVNDIYDVSCEDMESDDSAADRFFRVLDRYVAADSRDFAVVSHGGTINAALYRISGGAVGSGVTSLRNSDLSVLSWKDGVYAIDACDLVAEDLSGL